MVGEQSCVVANLPNLGMQLINIVTELYDFCTDLLSGIADLLQHDVPWQT